jgi:hypothetical protein
VAPVECAAHPEVTSKHACGSCELAICDACATYEIDGQVSCDACGRREDDKSRALGSTLLALVGVGYLATLALGVALFKPRPFVGGLAAVVSIALGRTLQMVMRPRAVQKRLSA